MPFNLGRIAAGEFHLQCRPVQWSTVVTELIAQRRGYHQGLEQYLRCRLHPVTVEIDPEAIKLVLDNLLDNALKYSPPDAPIFLRSIRLPTVVMVCVRDRGMGITPELLPHIFEKYETTGGAPHGIHRGTGLGLDMACLLVEAHGGRIGARSRIGQGTTMWLTLPRTERA